MAISRSFGGQTLLKPGAYSVSRVDNAQGIAVGENNTLMLIGEASDGNPGSEENSAIFTNIQQLVDYYGSGDIVDAALAAGRPSITPGISAPTNFITYKTNPSLKSITNLVFSGTFVAGETVSSSITFPINASGETYTIPTIITTVVGITAEEVAASVAADLLANADVVSVFNVIQVGAVIDIVAIKSGPSFGPEDALVNPDGETSVAVITNSTTGMIVPMDEQGVLNAADPTATIPTAKAALALNGLAAIGLTTSSELGSAFTDAFNFDPNVIIPLWSNAAIGTDPQSGVVRPADGITYLLAGAALQSHLIERSSVTVRKEAQGMLGARDADWRNTYAALDSAGINSFLLQVMIQDVRITDATQTLAWKGPHVMAAMMGGIRLGSTVGEPLTFKFLNANGVGHNINPSTGMPAQAANQFRPGFDFNEAILNGLTFTEIASGGNRIVVDNTRYAIDESFVFNRGSVIEAAQFVARTSRQILEQIFVGQKVSNGAAESLKNVLRNYLIQLNADNIITSSSDAPFGFVEETFTVTITGNTAEIQVEVKPVQGLDFIFIDFTLGNITQSA